MVDFYNDTIEVVSVTQQGMRGPQGIPGPMGPQGPQGPAGLDGSSASIPQTATDQEMIDTIVTDLRSFSPRLIGLAVSSMIQNGSISLDLGIKQKNFEIIDPYQSDFDIQDLPRIGVVMIYLNGLIQSDYISTGSVITLDPPAQNGDQVFINWI